MTDGSRSTPGERRATRRLEVLSAVVRAHVASGGPVGSLAVAEALGRTVSPATVRNVMAELEDEGLLSHAHHSAGRVPTDSGYRLHAGRLLAAPRERPAGATSGSWLSEALGRGEGLPDVLAGVSRALARLSGCVGLVLHPSLGHIRFRHAHFLRLDRSRVVAVVVGEGGLFSDRVVAVAEDYGQDELDRISSYVSNRFSGSTLSEVQRTLEAELREEQALCDAAVGQWLRLALSALDRCVGLEPVYADGAAAVLEAHEGGEESAWLAELLRAYEQKDRVARLLRQSVEKGGVQVRVGSGAGDETGLPGLTLVAAQYGEGHGAQGSVGVLGPTRMEYEKVIAVVDDVAQDLSQALRQGFDAAH